MTLTLKLVRHGESEANIGRVSSIETGDHVIALSDLGRQQACDVGKSIGASFVDGALIYTSPYRRARETLEGIYEGSGVKPAERARGLYEDPRLREVEHGYESMASQEEMRKTHGWFYYRFRGGESPADCYDRTSSFLESMMRQVERKQSERVLIVTHGLTIRCFVMRFMHLCVEEFDVLANPKNCAVITLGDKSEIGDCQYTSGRWGVAGLTIRTPEEMQPAAAAPPPATPPTPPAKG